MLPVSAAATRSSSFKFASNLFSTLGRRKQKKDLLSGDMANNTCSNNTSTTPKSSNINTMRPMSTTATKRPFTIVVEGNIGSGKTTFLDKFSEGLKDVEVTAEPVDQWRDVRGHNLLELLYSDPQRWSLLFQTYVQLTMLQQHVRPCDKPVRIMERSLLRDIIDAEFCARYCFVENLYSTGQMSSAEHAVLSEWFNFLVTCPQFDFGVDLIVYLRTDPEVAFQRVLARSRQEENKIPLEYLRSLHELHEDWLVRKTKFQPLAAPVMVVDANEDLGLLAPRYSDCREAIMKLAATAARN